MKNLSLIFLAAAMVPSAIGFVAPTQKLAGFSTRLASSEPDASAIDPFGAFGPDSTEIAIKEYSLGEGEGAADGDVVTISYTGRLFTNQQQFGRIEGLPVKLGKGNLVKGFEQSLIGKKPGSKYIVRIPSELAWADRGRDNNVGRQVIPPNSSVEFEVEVTNITNGIMGEVEMFGKDRVITLIFLICLSAGAPFIEKAVNGAFGI